MVQFHGRVTIFDFCLLHATHALNLLKATFQSANFMSTLCDTGDTAIGLDCGSERHRLL